MNKLFKYLSILSSALIVSCSGGGKLIPPDTMSEIYAEMFVADQWIESNGMTDSVKFKAVYEPVFRHYGYSVEDFRYSVKEYLKDGEKNYRIISESKEIIEERIKKINSFIELRDKAVEDSMYAESRKKIWEKYYSAPWDLCNAESKLGRNILSYMLFARVDIKYLMPRDTMFSGVRVIVDTSRLEKKDFMKMFLMKHEIERDSTGNFPLYLKR